MILFLHPDGTVEPCEWSHEEYCPTHSVHVISEGFDFTDTINMSGFAQQHKMMLSTPADMNPHIVTNKVPLLTEENLEHVLADIFEDETRRGVHSSSWDVETTFHIKIDELQKIYIASLEDSDIETYFSILQLFANVLLPLKKKLSTQLNIVENNRKSRKASIRFSLDLTSQPDSKKAEKLNIASHMDGVNIFQQNGKQIKMLTRQVLPKDTIHKILNNETPEKELAATKLEACIIEIVYTTTGDTVDYNVYAKGWKKLTKDETVFVNLLHRLKIEPRVDDIRKTITSINNFGRMIKSLGRV